MSEPTDLAPRAHDDTQGATQADTQADTRNDTPSDARDDLHAGARTNARAVPEMPDAKMAGTKMPDTEMPDTEVTAPMLDALLSDQPHEVLERGGVRYTLLGTAHVSRKSAEVVEALAGSGHFDAVAIELDAGRHAALVDPERWAKLDLFKVLREGKVALVAANLALSAFQQRIAEQFGIEPGQEMRAAIRVTREKGVPLILIDRDVGVTLRRVSGNLSWWQRLTLLSGLLASLLSREQVSEEEIEKLKEGDMLEATFAEFAERSGRLYTPLIAERDRYMAAKLREAAGEGETARYREVLVVVGAGHLKGLAQALREETGDPREIRRGLEQLPKPSIWPKLIPWLLVGFVLSGFAVGFARNPDFGLRLLSEWSLITGVLAALGATLALAHPLTILVSLITAPITTLHPLLGVGFVAAAVELWLRRPEVGDFSRLRHDVSTLRGWWRNRVAHTLLVFFLSSLGASVGFYLASARLFGKLFG